MVRGNPVGDFNTYGQSKCPYCGDYMPTAWIANHMSMCESNPSNQVEDDE